MQAKEGKFFREIAKRRKKKDGKKIMKIVCVLEKNQYMLVWRDRM